MSYPYLSDVLNALLGTQWHIPIAMFGTFVALALVVGAWLATKEFLRLEKIGVLPKTVDTTAGSIPPNQLVSDLVLICALFGIVGARVFHILDYPAEFLDDPASMIFTRAGFSIYGGLIFGVIAGVFYLRRYSIPITPVLDAVAPSMILGYGIGRIGCQVSGDGDWGILSNMALKPNWLPDWLWAQTYENNIAGVLIPEPGVYPTSIYETVAALMIFAFLWSVRKLHYRSGHLFSMYLLLTGFQRLLIEKIRVNKELYLFDIGFTQAELISAILILGGLIGIIKTSQSKSIPKVAFSIAVFGALTACAAL